MSEGKQCDHWDDVKQKRCHESAAWVAHPFWGSQYLCQAHGEEFKEADDERAAAHLRRSNLQFELLNEGATEG